ncbi:MAG: hypothetical protein PHR77_16880, partial [Kiritimatiellae bacterium]|nr:hypothetical protein [Kiritimatiellia bacterium]
MHQGLAGFLARSALLLGLSLWVAAGLRAEAAGIGYDPSALTFSGQVFSAIAPQTLTVSNAGDGTLNYTIASSVFWLSVSNSSGALASGESTQHMVCVATRGLAARTYSGQLTISDPAATNNPQVVGVALTLTNLVGVMAVDGWGDNNYGQCNPPGDLSNAVAIAGGGSSVHTLALRSDGTVAAWGSSTYGQTNVPVGLTNVVAVAVGGYHSLALRSDGTVMAWGRNSNGQTNVPAWLTNVVGVAGGQYDSLALRGDGTVAAWGASRYGQT